MKHVKEQKLFRNAYEKLLAFLPPFNLTTEENSKRILTGLIVIITCPVLLGYSLYSLFISKFVLSGVLALVFDLFCFSIHAKDPEPSRGGTENSVRSLTLEECLDITLRKNRRLVAKSSVEIAEAQSAYWPQMSFGMKATRQSGG